MASSHRVTSRASVFSNQKPVIIRFICYLKSRVIGVSDVTIKVFQVCPHGGITNGSQTVKIVISKPELAVQISKPFFVGIPTTVEVNRAVQTSLKYCPTSTARGHVTKHLYWFTAIWIDCVHSTGCESILKKLGAGFCL